jgi:O-antigen/teichoic acid export membrane protein
MHPLSWKLKKILKMVSPEEGKTLLNNFASLSVVQAITYILPVAILPYLFRVIGPGNT